MSADPGTRRYLKLKHDAGVYCVIVDMSMTSLQLRRQLSQMTRRRVGDMRIHLPAFGNRLFQDHHSLEQAQISDGSSLILVFRESSGEFPDVENIFQDL
jgi:hypothetical protein